MFSLEVLKADVFSGGGVQNTYLCSDENDFGGDVSASAGGAGIGGGNGATGASGNGVGNDNGGGGGGTGGGLDANANGGIGTIDLGANSPSAGTTMEFSATDAKAVAVEALAVVGGAVAVARGNVAAGVIGLSATTLNNSTALGTAMSHAAHDIAVSQTNSPLGDPNNIGLYGSTSEQGTIDAMNADGGFGNLFQVAGGQVLDQSVGGSVLATDQIPGGHSLYWDNFYEVNPYALVHF